MTTFWCLVIIGLQSAIIYRMHVMYAERVMPHG